MQQPDWLDRAWREFGVREVRGEADNPRIVAMFREVGHSGVKRDEVAWCAAFLGACLERAGHRSTRSLMARSYLTWGEPLDEPRPGAVAVLSRGANPALGHVGFVVGATAKTLFLLGGNQSQRVGVDAFDRARLLGLRWPAGAPSADPGSDVATRAPRAELHDDATAAPAAAKPRAFAVALAHVLRMEGGYSNDPHDPGGPTNKGITLEVFARWIGERVEERSRARLVARLRRIPDQMVEEIYYTRYWLPAGCAAMPDWLATMHFDTAVNHGVGTAIRLLQGAVGAGIDGEIGSETRGRIAASDALVTLVRYAELRRERYRQLHHFWRFGRGWLRRVDATLELAGKLARDAEANGGPADRSKPHSDLQPSSKGETTMTIDATQPEPKWWGESLTIWGVIVTALSTVLPVIGPLVGLDVSAEVVRQLGEQVVQIIQAIGGVAGTIMAIAGRMRAKAPIERRLISVRI